MWSSPPEIRRHAALGLSRSWSRQSPEEAHEWYLAEKATGAIGQKALQSVAKNVFSGALRVDPDTALVQFEAFDFDTQKAAIGAVTPYADDAELAAPVAKVITGISDDHLQLTVVEEFGERWARQGDVAAVTDWYDSMAFSDEARAFDAAVEINSIKTASERGGSDGGLYGLRIRDPE